MTPIVQSIDPHIDLFGPRFYPKQPPGYPGIITSLVMVTSSDAVARLTAACYKNWRNFDESAIEAWLKSRDFDWLMA